MEIEKKGIKLHYARYLGILEKIALFFKGESWSAIYHGCVFLKKKESEQGHDKNK